MLNITLLLSMLMIFCSRVMDVTLGTFRILQIMRGRKMAAAFVGFFEVMIYMTVLGHILGGGRVLLPMELVAYCLGFATGNYVGSYVEDRFMKGYSLVEAIAPHGEKTEKLVGELRAKGFGITVVDGWGKDGPVCVVKTICNRNDMAEITKIIGKDAFVSVFDVKRRIGGYFRLKEK